MTIPSLLFGLLVSTLIGAAFHLWRGGGLGRLIFYLILAWIGFWTGQVLADRYNLTIGDLGALHLGVASASCVVFLVVGYWLSKVDTTHK